MVVHLTSAVVCALTKMTKSEFYYPYGAFQQPRGPIFTHAACMGFFLHDRYQSQILSIGLFKMFSCWILGIWAFSTTPKQSEIGWELTLTVLVATTDAQWEGMGDVGLARYEPALLPPCPTIMVLSYSN